MGLKLLCLTDHTTHNEANSFYRLAEGINNDERVDHLYVATKGHGINKAFFDGRSLELHAIRMSSDFKYSGTHDSWDLEHKLFHLNDFDGIILRIPRTVGDHFFDFLEKQFANPQMIVNMPSGILRVSSKAFLLEVHEWCPPISLVEHGSDVLQCLQKIGPLVLKPLKQYGGKGIVRLIGDKVSDGQSERGLQDWINTAESEGTFPMLAMKYLPRVTEGDKRVIVANGEIIGASLRRPSPGMWLCNVAQGGRAEIADLTPNEIEIARDLGRRLLGYGVVVFGFDTLVADDGIRVLSEINALSPGGIWPAELQTGKPLTKLVAKAIIDYLIQQVKTL